MGAAGWRSFHMAKADSFFRADSPESLRSAVAIEPQNAAYHALLAEHLEGEGTDPIPELLSAVRLSPFDSQHTVRAATQLEIDGKFAEAEKMLLQAASTDRKFLPRWSLLNFYFRRGNDKEFWKWVRPALEMSGETPQAIFRLAWERTSDSAQIERLLPHNEQMSLQYLEFLVDTQRFDFAAPMAQHLATETSRRLPVLLSYCSRAVEVDPDSALKVWNTMATRKLIPLKTLDPASGALLSNPDFGYGPEEKGFDWRIPSVAGAYLEQTSAADGFRLRLDGSEPEAATVLWQTLPVQPATRYRIAYEYSGEDSKFNGLTWRVTNRGKLIAESPDLQVDSQNRQDHIEFITSEKTVRLELRYQRPSGAVRADGAVFIRHLTSQVVK
jgi:hypothetical protein